MTRGTKTGKGFFRLIKRKLSGIIPRIFTALSPRIFTAPSPRTRAIWVRKIQRGLLASCFCLALIWGVSMAMTQGVFGRAGAYVHDQIIMASARVGFRVDTILVEGRKRVASKDILKALNVKQGQAVFDIDLGEKQTAIANLAWIESVEVSRHLPSTIHVTVVERTPAALWQKDKIIHVIDRFGHILTNDVGADLVGLPLLSGVGANDHAADMINLLKAEPVIAARLDAAIFVSSRRWDLRLKNGLRVKLPENDAPLALARLAKRHQDEKILDLPIATIDLRAGDRMVIRTKQDELNEPPKKNS